MTTSIKINTEDKDKFLEDLREQTIRFLTAEKNRLKVEREFLNLVIPRLEYSLLIFVFCAKNFVFPVDFLLEFLVVPEGLSTVNLLLY